MTTYPLSIEDVPTPLLQRFSGAELAVMRYLYWMLRTTKTRSRDQQPQICPSEQYLSRKLRISLRTVQRAIRKAREMQVLWIRQFKRQGGCWYTNLYRIHHAYLHLKKTVRKRTEKKGSSRPPYAAAINLLGDDLTRRTTQSGPEPESEGGPTDALSDEEKDETVRKWLEARGIRTRG